MSNEKENIDTELEQLDGNGETLLLPTTHDENSSRHELEKKNAYLMLISHFLTRMARMLGDKMWEFIVPLILSIITPKSLVPASLFGLVTTLSCVLLGTSIGRQIDIRSRLTIIRLGIGMQAISVGVSSVLLFALIQQSGPELEENIFATRASSILLILLLISAAIGALSALSMDISVERDWIPTAISKHDYLLLMNTRMRQVDLVTEVAGPFIAGLLVVIPGFTATMAFLTVAAINFITFVPQYLLLLRVYQNDARLRTSKTPPSTDESNEYNSILCGDWNPIANLVRGWTLFIRQPIALVTISFSLLWLTVLSPHNIIFTAYLKQTGYAEWELGIFRGIGALMGVIATFVFPWVAAKFGLVPACLAYIFEEAICLLGAGIVFSTELLQDSNPVVRTLFLIFILLSRCGLYGFEVGEIQMLQQGIPEKIRGHVNSVEQSLTSLASVAVFVAGTIVNDPMKFGYLVWSSVAFIWLGAIVFLIWTFKWTYLVETHTHGDPEIDQHGEYHTSEQEESLRENKTHTHGYFRRRR